MWCLALYYTFHSMKCYIYTYMVSFHTLYFLNTEIARINELRAMADMLQKQLEKSSVQVPGSNCSGGGSGSGGPMGSRGGGYRSRSDEGMGGAGGRSDESDCMLVSNLNEKVCLYLVYIYVFHFNLCIKCIIFELLICLYLHWYIVIGV